MGNSKSILKDTYLYFFSKLIPGIAGISFLILLTRKIGLSEFGVYSLYFSQCNLIVSFCFGWLNQSELRYSTLPKSYNRPSHHILVLICLTMCFSIVFLLNQLDKYSTSSMFFSLYCIFSIGIFTYVKTLYQSQILPKKVLVLTNFQSLLFLIFPFLADLYFDVSSNLLLISTGSSFLLASLIIFFDKKFTEIIKIKFSYSNILKWLKFGIPVSIWSSLGLLLHYLDRFFINNYLDTINLGVYSTISEISIRIFSFLIFPITLAVHPRITKLWNEDKKLEAFTLINKSVNIIFLVLLIIGLIIVIFNNLFFSILNYGIPSLPESSKIIFLPLIMSGIFWQLSLLTHKVIELNEKTHLMIVFILFSVAINIIVNTLFISQYGIIVTALSSLASSFTYCLLTWIYSMYFIKSKVFKI